MPSLCHEGHYAVEKVVLPEEGWVAVAASAPSVTPHTGTLDGQLQLSYREGQVARQ